MTALVKFSPDQASKGGGIVKVDCRRIVTKLTRRTLFVWQFSTSDFTVDVGLF